MDKNNFYETYTPEEIENIIKENAIWIMTIENALQEFEKLEFNSFIKKVEEEKFYNGK